MTTTDPTSDQIAAAVAHTTRVMEGTAAATGRHYRRQVPAPAAGPITDRLHDWHIATNTPGSARLRVHLRRGPQPAFGFLALPGEMVCARCMPQLRASYHRRIPDDQCDTCRQPTGMFRELSIQPEGTAVMLTGNVCDRCHRAGFPDAPPAGPPPSGPPLAAVLRAVGACRDCDAEQRIEPDPNMPGLTILHVLHDDDCPTLARKQGRR